MVPAKAFYMKSGADSCGRVLRIEEMQSDCPALVGGSECLLLDKVLYVASDGMNG